MKRIIVSILSLVMMLTFFAIPTHSKSDLMTEQFESGIQKLIDEGKAKGAIATLIINQEIAMSKGFGYSDQLSGIKAEQSYTGFRIGSISKTFVAVAALIAYQEGVLDLNKDISFYLENDFPKLKYPVTMHQLLTHTAGFEEVLTGMAVVNVSDTEPLNVSIRKYMPEQIHRPGEIASYSNYGIALAAYVIERAVNEDFKDYCTNNLFLPLEMERTTFDYMTDKAYISKAYLPNGNETVDMYINLYPEGSVISTSDDMGRYILWLLSEEEKVLKKDIKDMLFKRQYYMADELGGIGYTWNRKIRNENTYYDKKGETLHFYSRIVLYPNQKAGLFLSFNTYVPEKQINKITDIITDYLLGEKDKRDPLPGATININGYYVNSWSGFQTAEKVLRFIIPGKLLYIKGSLSDGYKLNDEEMIHLGNNVYDTPMGIVKFIEKGSKLYLATDFSQAYIKISVFESPYVIGGIVLLFLLSCIIYLIIILKTKRGYFLIPTLQLISFIALIVFLYIGLSSVTILNQLLYINISGWVIVITFLINMALTYCIKKQVRKTTSYANIHNIISLLFSIVLLNMNFLN